MHYGVPGVPYRVPNVVRDTVKRGTGRVKLSLLFAFKLQTAKSNDRTPSGGKKLVLRWARLRPETRTLLDPAHLEDLEVLRSALRPNSEDLVAFD